MDEEDLDIPLEEEEDRYTRACGRLRLEADVVVTEITNDDNDANNSAVSKGNFLTPGSLSNDQQRKSPVTVQEWVASLPTPNASRLVDN